MTTDIVLIIANLLLNLGVFILILYKFRKIKTTESEFYTDYVKGDVIMRVYKPEFELQAIGNLKPSQILDAGNLSLYYKWALIKKK
jgi:hypothetical protein